MTTIFCHTTYGGCALPKQCFFNVMFLKGRPGPPRIRNNETELPGRNVTVLWSRPPENNCNITMYSLRYRVVKPTTEQWEEVNITDANITSYELHLQYSKKYSVKVSAWNDLGRSVESKTWEVRTAQCEYIS